MKKLTPAEKKQYFALYWGQKVVNNDYEYLSGSVHVSSFVINQLDQHDYLSLRSIEQLTPKELKELSEITHITYTRRCRSHKEKISHIDKEHLYLSRRASEFLRSIGIATPWKHYSIQDLIDNNVLKFQSNGR